MIGLDLSLMNWAVRVEPGPAGRWGRSIMQHAPSSPCQTLHSTSTSHLCSSSLTALTNFQYLRSQFRLNGGTLDGSQLSVTLPGSSSISHTADSSDSIALGQEDKPRTAIVAEYLAHGYALSDDITKRAIDLDQKHGLSNRFKSYLSTLDRSLGESLSKASSSKMTESNEHTPSGQAASESVTEKNASMAPVPGASPADLGPKTTTDQVD